MEKKEFDLIFEIFEKKIEERNDEEKNILKKFYDNLGAINNNYVQKDIIDKLLNYFKGKINILKYLYEKDITKNSKNKIFYQILFDLYIEFGHEDNLILNILHLLTKKINIEKEKIYYILRIIGSMIRNNNINFKKLNNSLKLLFELLSIDEEYKTNIFLLGGANIFLPLFEIVYKNLKKIESYQEKIILQLINLIKYLIYDDDNLMDALNSNFFPLLTIFLIPGQVDKLYNNIFQIYEQKRNKEFSLLVKSFILNLSIINNCSLETQEKYIELLKSNSEQNIDDILLKNKMYVLIQISELKSNPQISQLIMNLGQYLFINLELKEMIYFIKLLNDDNKNIDIFLDNIDFIDNGNLSKNDNLLILEYINSFINLLFNNYNNLKIQNKENLMNFIFKIINNNENIINDNQNLIYPFSINIIQKIKLSKRLLNPQIIGGDSVKKLVLPLKFEINLITFLFQKIYGEKLEFNNLKNRRKTNEIINKLEDIFNKENIRIKKRIDFLLIELVLCSYLKEKNIIKNKNGIYELCIKVLKKEYENKNLFSFVLNIFNYLNLSKIPKNEYITIFQIFIEIYHQLFYELNNYSNIDDFYETQLKNFEKLIVNIFKLKFLDNIENQNYYEILNNDYINNNNNNQLKNFGEKIYKNMKYLDTELGNFFEKKNAKEFFTNLSFYYFDKITSNKNIIKIIKSYIMFLEVCKYLTSHETNLLVFDKKNEFEENKKFFILFFEIHLKFISMNILSLKDNEIKNLFYSIFFYMIEYINYYNEKKNKNESSLFNAFSNFKIKIPINEDEINIDSISEKIFNEKYITLDLYQLSNELFEDSTYIELINLKTTYKKIKKRLFSFNGPYSAPEFFYNNINESNTKKLIYKESNHLTSEYSQPLLVPILDYNFYLPNNNIGFSIFDENYKNFYQIDLSFKNKFKNLLFYDKYFNGFNVCLITPIIHYKGKIQLFNNHIIFYTLKIEINPEKEKNSSNNILCRGSYFISDKKKNYLIKYSDIKLIIKKYYYYEYQNLEIYTQNKSYYIEFNNEKERNLFLNNFINKTEKYNLFSPITNNINEKNKKNHIIGYYNKNYKEFENIKDYKDIIKKWQNNSISTFHFLMLTNILGNRSLNDLSQYPIFPWILTNYNIIPLNQENNEKLTKEELITNHQRNLSIPMGLMEINENSKSRKKNYIFLYKLTLEEHKIKLLSENPFPQYDYNFEELISNPKIPCDGIPNVFNSHFSNPAYVSHFLTKIFPFTISAYEIQGNSFDSPDRLFINISKTFQSCIGEKCDIRELIPQFFYLPQMFKNINHLNFGNLQIPNNLENTSYDIFIKIKKGKRGDIVKVENTLLPNWSDNNEYKFICLYREILESGKLNIEKWCDLMFGIKLRGKKAQEIGNLYNYYTYWECINCRKNIFRKNNELSNYLDFAEFGQNPIQIINEEISNKIQINDNQLKKSKINKFKLKNDKFGEKEYKIGKDENSLNEISQILNDDKNILDKSKVSFIEYDEINKFIFCGTVKGSVLIFKLNQIKSFLYKGIHDHDGKINCIHSHSNLNMFIDCSDDCFINVYTLPDVKLVSSVFLEGIIPIYSFLSMIPVPCFIIYLKGEFISEKEENDDIINLPLIKIDSYFNEYLNYNNKKKLLKIFFFKNQCV